MTVVKSKERKNTLGEVFTPTSTIDEMLELLQDGILSNPSKTFLDPTCGNGNILVRILERRLELGLDPVESVSTLYGIDIMEDNVIDTKTRLFKMVPEAKEVIEHNIIQHDITTFVFEDEFEFDEMFDDEPQVVKKATDWDSCVVKHLS